MMNLVAHSQNTTGRTDTCVSWSLLRKLLIGAQEGDYYKAELFVTDTAFNKYRERTILNHRQDSLLIVALRYDSLQQRGVRVMQQGVIDQLYKTIKKQKRKTIFVGIMGIATTAFAFYLSVK